MSNRFSAGLGKLREAGGKTPPAQPEPQTTSRDDNEPKRYEQANRRGKVIISAYFDPAVRKQLAMLAVEQDTTQAALISEALNMMFEKYGRSPIAKA